MMVTLPDDQLNVLVNGEKTCDNTSQCILIIRLSIYSTSASGLYTVNNDHKQDSAK